jgi:carbon storage regulator
VLSLARRQGQKIRIGEDIVLVVREIRGRQVKIGIEAPPHVRVLREEIYEELVEANQAAATAPDMLPEELLGTGLSGRKVNE